ncbi:hypothetical protein LK994_11655 [Ferruginibacter lapsinanis]|uniref:hypothetical protein n=1 Tax=Ferruginibacter lapsinanis TaxID=563172 RepID=UPI001E2940E2|nr:hypothetical protein [Ferruginibacter lapsinanis]UEG49287.1 hypothetical protein LK994_11655 [Ferruginibacter lapsinanis]
MSNIYFTTAAFQDLHTPEGVDALIGLINEIKNDKEENEKFYVKEGNIVRQVKYSEETDSLYLGEPISENI